MRLSIEMMKKLGDAQNALKALIANDEATVEQIEAKTAEINTLKAKVDAQLAIEAAEDAEMGIAPSSPVVAGADAKALYEDAFYSAITGKALTAEQSAALQDAKNALSSTSGEDGGYLIPVDQQVAIRELKRQYDNLEDLVSVEPVSTLTGNRNMEKDAQYTPFVEFSEGADVPASDTPQFVNIPYAIKDRGGIMPVPNNLMADEKANLKNYLNNWLAKKSVATRNSLIVTLLNTKAKTAITTLDDVKNSLNVTLDPAISAMATVVMNQDSFNKFDKMKDVDGNYILQPNPVNPTQKMLAGRPVKVVSNKTLPTRTADSKNYAPVIMGSLKEAIVLFDRQAMSLLTTNIGGQAFLKNRTEIRAITREDVRGFDMNAIVFGEIEV